MSIFNLISMIGGLTFFLYGMNVMSSSLEKMAGGKLEEMLRKMTANPMLSLALGAAITIAVQSSSAVTVMLVGLVNSGIMALSQTVGVIMGANIGTTITAWLLSLVSVSGSGIFMQMLKPTSFTPILALVGTVLIMMAKSEKKKEKKEKKKLNLKNPKNMITVIAAVVAVVIFVAAIFGIASLAKKVRGPEKTAEEYVEALICAESRAIEIKSKPERSEQRHKLIIKDIRLFYNSIDHAVDIIKKSGIPVESSRNPTSPSFTFPSLGNTLVSGISFNMAKLIKFYL